MLVTVILKNAPSDAVYWDITLVDWNVIAIVDHLKEGVNKGRLAIDEAAVFDVPDIWGSQIDRFPLRVVSLVISKWKDGSQELLNPGGTIQQLYYVQSYRPFKWDFGKGGYGDVPEPTYREVFIPDYGEYSYDVAAEQFESLAPEPTSIEITAPDSAEVGEEVSVSTRVTNVSADSRLFRVTLYAVRDIFAVPDPGERIGSLEVVIGSGQSQVVSGSFTMPAWDTTVLVMVHRFIDFWDFDNSASKIVISLRVPVEEFAGSIVKKELEYNGSKKAIPVY